MKKLLPLFLALAGSVPALAGTLQPAGSIGPNSGHFWPGKKIEIGWIAKGLSWPSAKIKVTLLQNGAPLRVLGSGLAPTWSNQQDPQRGGIWWTPTVSDIGCNYAVLVATEDGSASFTSQRFGVFAVIAAMEFPNQDQFSNVRLDQPTAGSVLVLGQSRVITWSLNADPKLWPSKKLKLELFFSSFKVGDIAEVPLDFAACPVSGAYTWLVGKVTNGGRLSQVSRIPDGKNLIPGNEYWIRATGDGRAYATPRFVISGESHLPAPGATPVHKLPTDGGSVPGKPLP
jgi:hypothetical protein